MAASWLLLLAAAAALGAEAQHHGPPLPWAARPEAEGFDSRTLDAIAPEVNRLVEAKAIPGAVVLGARNGKLVLNVTAGGGAFSSDRGEGPILRLFSLSKLVTSVLALAAIDKGLLALDDPIAKYLPELAHPTVYQGVDSFGNWNATPAPRCPTVKELMTHTAGFSYVFDAQHPIDRAYMLAGFGDMRDLAGGSAEFVRALQDIPLFAAPNTTWHYSISYDVLGVILERVTQQPLDAILRDYLTGPLGLLDTDFFVPPSKAHRLPPMEVELNDAPYSLQPTNEHYRPPFFSGGAGLYSSAGDFLRVAQMLLNGGELDGVRILSEAAVAAMTQNQLPPSALPFYLGGYRGSAFGLGVQVTGPDEAGPSRPLGEVSWGGFAGTRCFLSPALKTAIVTMSQHAPTDGGLTGAVKPLFFEALRKGGGMEKATKKTSPSLRGKLAA